LKIIDSEEIVFELSGSYSPGIIRPVDDPNYLYLALPVRTS
ncbi:MAG: DNA polymerase III subunit beta, partial [Bacillota bacterium]